MTTKHSSPWQVYLINLDRSPDRLEFQKEQLDKLTIPFVRVPAIDGNELSEDLPKFDNKAYDFRHGKSANANEVGCYLSHYEAINQFMQSSHEFAVILEDDAKLNDNIITVIDALLACRDLWDVVNLNGRHHGMPIRQKNLTNQYNLVAYLFRRTGAAGYLINRNAGEKYLKKLLPMKVPYDHEYDRAWVYGFRYRGVYPPVVQGVTDAKSTVGYNEVEYGPGNSIKKKPGWRRGSILLYRGWNEFSRLAHYIVRGLFIPRI